MPKDSTRPFLSGDAEAPEDAWRASAPAVTGLRLLVIEYLTDARQRTDPQPGDLNGRSLARGWSDGAWRVLFDASALRSFFAPGDEAADDGTPYHAPVPNGIFLVRGRGSHHRFLVEEILQREDIVSRDGTVFVTDWPAGAESFRRRWLRPPPPWGRLPRFTPETPASDSPLAAPARPAFTEEELRRRPKYRGGRVRRPAPGGPADRAGPAGE